MSGLKTLNLFKNALKTFSKNEFRKSHVRLNRNALKNSACYFCSMVPSQPKKSPIEVDHELDLSTYGSVLLPTYNFAAYADKSKLLQEFIKLGVELYKIERRPDAARFLLQLDFEKNVKPHLFFLHENGVPPEKLGYFITKNPFIFKENPKDLEVRVNYLKSKKFNDEMISNILTTYPHWLSLPVIEVDKQLGYLQKTFNLTGDDIRAMITKVPKLVTTKKKQIMTNTYVLKEELGLNNFQLKQVIVNVPTLLRRDEYKIVSTYDYITKEMKIPVDLLLKQPSVLLHNRFTFKERHEFLQALGRAQYNPLLPGYVELLDLVRLRDNEFCEKVARVSVSTYNEFLKSL